MEGALVTEMQLLLLIWRGWEKNYHDYLPACSQMACSSFHFPIKWETRWAGSWVAQYAGDRATETMVENGSVWGRVDMAKENTQHRAKLLRLLSKAYDSMYGLFPSFQSCSPNRYTTAFYTVGWDSIWSYVTDFGDHEKLDNSKRFLNLQWQKINSKRSTYWTGGVFGSAHSVGSHGLTGALVWTYNTCALHCAYCHIAQFQQMLCEIPQLTFEIFVCCELSCFYCTYEVFT